MSKIHELLAVEKAAKTQFTTMLQNLGDLFSKKITMFQGMVRTLQYFGPVESQEERMALEAQGAETKVINTTPKAELNFTLAAVERYVDIQWQKNRSNSTAVADLVLNGTVLVSNAPATFLLGLESWLAALRASILMMPTRDNSIAWTADPNMGEGYFKSPERRTSRTKKMVVPVELSKATDKHPAQVTQISEDKPVGTFTEIQYTTLLSSADKAAILTRIDDLIRATKEARQRANGTDADTTKVASTLLKHVFGNLYSAT